MKKLLKLFIVITGFLLSFSANSQSIYFVKPGGSGTGVSWNDASGDIQAMINKASEGDEIWVASGTYTPSDLPGASGTLGSRDVSFVLKSGVKLYGGFSGSESTLEQRNHEINKTILSGDIGTTGQNSDNAYHVIISVKNTSNTLVDGFIISGGYANAPGAVTIDGINVGRQSGGGVYAYSSETVFKNVAIEKNTCAGGEDFFGNGGGVYAGISRLSFEDSRITDNSSERAPGKSGGTSGALFVFGSENNRASLKMSNVLIEKNKAMNLAGAIYISSYTDAEFFNVDFIENDAEGAGGAIRIDGANADNFNNFIMEGGSFIGNSAVGTGGALYIWSFTNYNVDRVNFIGNEATSAGGAMFLFSGGGAAAPNDKAVISNSVFYNNKANGASLGGGAIFLSNGTQLQLSNSTFYSNYAKFDGGAIGVFSNAVVKADIHNSIFYGNTTDGSNTDFYVGALATLNLSNSITQKQGTDGINGVKVNVDPLFASTDPNNVFFLRLLEASPAIDAGDNDRISAGRTLDLAGKERVVNDIVDMGAYEYVEEGGPTITQSITFDNDVIKTYGDDSFTPVATASSGLPVHFAVSDSSVAIVENNQIIIKGAGTATIQATQPGNFEYLPADTVFKTITINKADLVIKPADTMMVQGDPLPVFRLIYSGFVYGENETNLSAQPQVSTTATSASEEGDYPITVANGAADNYNLIYEEGKLSVSVHYPEGKVRYVKPAASGNGSGLSWADASDNLQAMIDSSSAGGEVWVAAGTYIPESLPGLSESPDSRSVSFVLKSGVGVYGGFLGNETRRSDRDFVANETILSGDAGISGDNSDNAYHVVLSLRNTGNTILDGFTIKDGYAGGSGSYTVSDNTVLHNSGAGIYVQESHGLSMHNLKITGNTISGSGQGAGLFMKSSTLVLQNSEITSNNISGATAMGGGFFSLGEVNAINTFRFSGVKINNNTSQRTAGGGYIRYYSVAEMEDVEMDGNAGTEGAALHTVGQLDFQNLIKITRGVFKNHAASGNGGAFLVAQYVSLELYETEFSNNSGGSQGGSIYITGNLNRFNRLIIDKSKFDNNRLNATTSNGGAIRVANYVDAWITNSVFSNNESSTGGAVSLTGSSYGPSENLHLINNVFFKNKSRTVGSSSGGGAVNTGVYMTANFINNTFYNNEAGSNGGAVQANENNFTFLNLYNNIFYGNKANAGDDLNWPNTHAKVSLKNNLTQIAGNENEDGAIIGVNPEFESVDPSSPNFLHLSILSPAFNKGNNLLLPADITLDHAGNDRIVYNIVDMGAFEYAGPPLNPVDAQTITFNGDIIKTYGEPLFNPGATASSGLPVSYIISNQNVARVGSNNLIQLVGGGVTQISAYQPGNAQYLPSDTITVTLTVNKAALVIKPEDVEIEQGNDFPVFSANYAGFVYNDNASALTTLPVITTTATESSPVGVYPLTASGAQSDKYEISYQPGVLSIIEPPRFPAEKYNLNTWFSSATELQISVDMVAEQSGSIVIYTNAGVPVYSSTVQLKMGTNRFTIPADRILPGVYIVNVRGNGFKLDKKIIKR